MVLGTLDGVSARLVADPTDGRGQFVLIYVLQIREAMRGRPEVLFFFSLFATAVWSMWALKTTIARRYRPWREPHEVTASVIVPVVDEPVGLFHDVLQRIVKQEPHEVIVVINGSRNPALEEVCDDLGVMWRWTEVPGKRNAVRIGIGMATGELCVLVDSDTIWADDTLIELSKPFADPRVGGVTTKQRILDPRRSFLTRWADWMENSRARYSMPAQSVLGHVGCLPGRTIAFRREILERVMDDFMQQRFLGVFLEISDDRTLTNLTLKSGYRTVFQESSIVFTDSPVRIGKLFRQQLRWSRGSQYNTLRMLPWMLAHTPMLAVFFVMDILLPFLLLGAVMSWVWHAVTGTGVDFISPTLESFPGLTGWLIIAALVVGGSTMSMWVRQHRHLVDEPRDWLWMPTYILFSSVFLMPIRLLGFFRMAHVAGWGTRRDAYAGASQRLNPRVGIPYLIGALLIGAELAVITRT
jgi:hyaluronan synthase